MVWPVSSDKWKAPKQVTVGVAYSYGDLSERKNETLPSISFPVFFLLAPI